MTDATPDPRAREQRAPDAAWRPTPAWRATLHRWWRAGQERSLVIRRRGVDHVRLPLNLVVFATLLLAAWSWPVLLLAVVVSLVTQVEFVVQRDTGA
jgi:hypothetical protein